MEMLKTNRSKGLYIALSVIMKFLPAVIIILALKSLASDAQRTMLDVVSGYGGGLVDMVSNLLIFLIVLLAATIGYLIYVLALFSGVCKDMNAVCGKYNVGKGSLAYILVWLLSGITLNIYYVVWTNQQAGRMEEAAGMYGRQAKSKSTHVAFASLAAAGTWISVILTFMLRNGMGNIFIILIGFALSFLFSFFDIANMAAFLGDVNTLAEAYNGQADAPYGGAAGYAQQGSNAQMAGDDDHTISVNEWMPQPGQAARAGGCMACCAGVYEGAEFPIDGELVIGRDETSCHVVIKSPEVSRRHCGVRYNPNDGTYTVTDFSSNGVYYKNGQAFPKNQPMVCGAGTVLVIAQSGNEFLLK